MATFGDVLAIDIAVGDGTLRLPPERIPKLDIEVNEGRRDITFTVKSRKIDAVDWKRSQILVVVNGARREEIARS